MTDDAFALPGRHALAHVTPDTWAGMCDRYRTDANAANQPNSGDIEPAAGSTPRHAALVACAAYHALLLEVATWPKPGLVSHVDAGSHRDMSVATFYASARSLCGYFERITHAGARRASMDTLRRLGIEAETAMLRTTAGVNTHRGAIFGVGLLCAAAGFRHAASSASDLGAIVAQRWGEAILSAPLPAGTHGTCVQRRHGAAGARAEAAAGFPSVYGIALPALRAARGMRASDAEAQRVQVFFALLAEVEDTNVLHRGGVEGARWARAEARRFLAGGGIAHRRWRQRAAAIHREFVARRLSPGGCADLLAMCLLVDALDGRLVGQT